MKKRQLRMPFEVALLMINNPQNVDLSVFKKPPKFLWAYKSPLSKVKINWFAAAPLVSNVRGDWGFLHIYSEDTKYMYIQGIHEGTKNWRGARRAARKRGAYEQEP